MASEAKKVDQKRRRVLKACERANTEDLLEVLRHRTMKAQKKAAASSTSAASVGTNESAAEDGESEDPVNDAEVTPAER